MEGGPNSMETTTTTTNPGESKEGKSFVRSSMTPRTPPRTPTVQPPKEDHVGPTSNILMPPTEHEMHDLTVEGGPNAGTPSTPKPNGTKGVGNLFQPKVAEKFNSATEKAADMVKKLDDMMRPKTNILRDARVLATSLRGQMKLVLKEHEELRLRAEKAEKALEERAKPGRRAEKVGGITPLVDLTTIRGPRTPKRTRTPEAALGGVPKKINTAQEPKDMQWSRVVGRKQAKAANQASEAEKASRSRTKTKEDPKPKKARKQRAEALVVEVPEGVSHAEMIRKAKSDGSLKDMGENMARIRRTQKGDLLFELKRDPNVKSAAYKDLLESALGGGAKVRALSQMVTIQIRDLEETTTAEQVSEALNEQFQLSEQIEAKSIRIRKAFAGTQTAELRLHEADANKLLELGKVKVGWTRNVIRCVEKTEVLRCFKCMGFGHMAKFCKGEDRTSLCRRCGEAGHKAKGCEKPAKCMLCSGEATNHPTGGRECPTYKKARSNQTNKPA